MKSYIFGSFLIVVLVAFSPVSLNGSANAAAPAAPWFGITPTPTPTPDVTPTSSAPPTETPVPPDTPTPTAAVPPPSSPEPPSGGPDLVTVKRANPTQTVPGGEVVFTIEVTNRGDEAAVDVVVIDEVSEWLEIVTVTTNQGTVSIEGQTVRVEVGVVGPGFTVEIVIRTRVRNDVPIPLELENGAIVRAPGFGERASPPVTISIPGLITLPLAGQPTPTPIWLLLIVAGGLLVLWAWLLRRSHAHSEIER